MIFLTLVSYASKSIAQSGRSVKPGIYFSVRDLGLSGEDASSLATWQPFLVVSRAGRAVWPRLAMLRGLAAAPYAARLPVIQPWSKICFSYFVAEVAPADFPLRSEAGSHDGAQRDRTVPTLLRRESILKVTWFDCGPESVDPSPHQGLPAR